MNHNGLLIAENKQASDKYDGESIQHKYKTDYKNVLGTDVIRGEQEKLL